MTASPETVNAGAEGPSSRDNALWPSSFWYIAATVAGFVIFWPLGVAMLAWAIWHRQIKASGYWQSLRGARVPRPPDFSGFGRRRPSNEALAEYLEREQQRLREEQDKLDELVKAFQAFKSAERKANDQRDFETFLRQREERGEAGSAR